MPKIIRECHVERTARVMQMEGMFDVDPEPVSRVEWDVDLPVRDADDDWNIGLIVGPSGCGKTTIARELFGDHICDSFGWPEERSVLDGFPDEMGITDITGLLSSVGFSSPPNWLRPHRVLSNGEQFRANVARALAESPELAVMDEFTSVVDRTVAQIGSAAVAKAVRRRGQKFIAVACHFDIIDWLDPDGVYEPLTGEFQRRRERRRPPITLTIRRVHHSAWKLFRGYHYLSATLNKASRCFVAFTGSEPVAFCSVLHHPQAGGGQWREHRTVCRPDFQGVGIGNALSEYVCSLYHATGKRMCSTTSSPAMIRHRDRSRAWRRHRKHGLAARPGPNATIQNRDNSSRTNRMTSGFTYVGPARPDDARGFGILK